MPAIAGCHIGLSRRSYFHKPRVFGRDAARRGVHMYGSEPTGKSNLLFWRKSWLISEENNTMGNRCLVNFPKLLIGQIRQIDAPNFGAYNRV
jgi:hypothetical protein